MKLPLFHLFHLFLTPSLLGLFAALLIITRVSSGCCKQFLIVFCSITCKPNCDLVCSLLPEVSQDKNKTRGERPTGHQGVCCHAGASIPLTRNDVLVTWNCTWQTSHSSYSKVGNRLQMLWSRNVISMPSRKGNCHLKS